MLVMVLINGLVPAMGEFVEAAVHRATTGHFAHDQEQEHDRGEQGEHGCGTTAHLCRCCVSQPMLSGFMRLPSSLEVASRLSFAGVQCPVTAGHVRGPFRPPIG